jgi:lactoylglutathione lyase
MKIEHLAIWTNQLEELKNFYCNYFKAESSDKYHNPNKEFSSYFLTFKSGSRLELMHRPKLKNNDTKPSVGLAHFAFSVGSEAEVDRLTKMLKNEGYPPIDGPRRTGDGYYESTFHDPDGNIVELTV